MPWRRTRAEWELTWQEEGDYVAREGREEPVQPVGPPQARAWVHGRFGPMREGGPWLLAGRGGGRITQERHRDFSLEPQVLEGRGGDPPIPRRRSQGSLLFAAPALLSSGRRSGAQSEQPINN